jgi:hypothetical protein
MSESDQNEKEWRQFYLTEIREIRKSLQDIQGQMEGLKVKSGVWGMFAGGVPVFVILAVQYLKGKLGGPQ